MIGIKLFLNTVFDDYAKEYGEFFQDQIRAFDVQFESLKREIYLNQLAEKGSQGATTQNTSAILMDRGDTNVNGAGTFSSRVEGY